MTMPTLIKLAKKLYQSPILNYGIMLIGCVVRLAAYLYNRNVWWDEIYLANNIINRSFGELLKPLDNNQSAPVGFLYAVKVLTQIVGTREFVLRFVPLVTGITSIFLFYYILSQTLPRVMMPIGVLLFSVSPHLIYYSSELKQYSSDMFFALLVLSIAVNCLNTDRLSPTRLIALALTGIIAVWMSFPAIFILAGTGLTLLLVALRRSERQKAVRFVVIGVLWLVSFGLNYFIFARSYASSNYLLSYWSNPGRNGFIPLSPSAVVWMFDSILRWLRVPLGFGFRVEIFGGLALLAFIIGWIRCYKEQNLAVWLILSPLAFGLIASALKLYPFSDRLILYTVPIFLVVILLGLQCLLRNTSNELRLVGVLISALIIFDASYSAAFAVVTPSAEVKQGMAYIASHKQSNDTIYVDEHAIAPYEYYLPRYNLADLHYVKGTVRPESVLDASASEPLSLHGNSRVWLLLDQPLGFDLYVAVLNRSGAKQLERFQAYTVNVYLYDMSQVSETAISASNDTK